MGGDFDMGIHPEPEDGKTASPFAKSDFKQQRQKSWKPELTPNCVLITFITVGVLFLIVGCVTKVTFDGSHVTAEHRYDQLATCQAALKNSTCYHSQRNQNGHKALQGSAGEPADPLCARRNGAEGRSAGDSNMCEVDIKVEEDMKAPVFVYYKLGNVYQNHREYAAYDRSSKQLQADPEAFATKEDYVAELETQCGKFAEYCKTGTLPSSIPGRFWCNPCGSASRSFFTDTFEMLNASGAVLPWHKASAGELTTAWGSDIAYKFKNTGVTQLWNNRTADENALVTDPDFMVWMRPSGLSDMRKLYRIINKDLPKGTYKLRVFNNYDVEVFEGTKAIELATVSWLGAPNPAISYAYIFVGLLCLVGALFIVIAECKHKQSIASKMK